jgi:glycosyltransferase involved in cell wall biosynthesis
MDKANLALAHYLTEQGTPVHVVCHSVDSGLASHPLVTVHLVARPAASFLLGGPLLHAYGYRIARRVTEKWVGARVVVNGGNCLWSDINWFHCVHHAWRQKLRGGPPWLRAKYGLGSWLARKRERAAAQAGRLFIANSNRTREDLVHHLHVDPERVHTVYLGAEGDWGPVTAEERRASRDALGIPESRPIAVFVGALGFEHTKGFDILFESWRCLCARPDWDADLLAAGAGGALPMWRQKASQARLSSRVRMLGFTPKIRELLAAADLLISPARYDAYGLNVQEAICRGVPAIVSTRAGVSERYSPQLAPLLIADPENTGEVTEKLLLWRSQMEAWKECFQELGGQLRAYGWSDMAERIVSIANSVNGKRGMAGVRTAHRSSEIHSL